MTVDEIKPNNGIPQNQSSEGYMHTDVIGAINQHTPSYWRLALPALGARYVGRYATQFYKNYKNDLDELKQNKIFDAIAGIWMLGITAFFAYRTGKDMKGIFSEAVGYELNKEPQDVTISDLLHSKNKAVVEARSKFISYNFVRTAVNSAFFASFVPGVSQVAQTMQKTSSVDLGVGANGAYLTLEILGRGRTFFEQVQSFVDLKLSPKNLLGEQITASELMQLYQRNAMDNDKENIFDTKTHPEIIRSSQVIFERMAELMNETYLNRAYSQSYNFTLPKFLYMVGFDLIKPQEIEKSLLYIEIANTLGMNVLKEVVSEVKNGADVQVLAQKYGVTINAVKDTNEPASLSQDTHIKKYAESVHSKNPGTLVEKGDIGFVGRIKEPQIGPALSN